MTRRFPYGVLQGLDEVCPFLSLAPIKRSWILMSPSKSLPPPLPPPHFGNSDRVHVLASISRLSCIEPLGFTSHALYTPARFEMLSLSSSAFPSVFMSFLPCGRPWRTCFFFFWCKCALNWHKGRTMCSFPNSCFDNAWQWVGIFGQSSAYWDHILKECFSICPKSLF